MDNLNAALSAAINELRAFRDSEASGAFCYGKQGEIGTPEVINALRELQRHISQY